MRLIRLTLLFLLAFTQLARAQNGTIVLPACAVNCMLTYIPKSPCAFTDQACLCTNERLQEDITGCVESTCSVKEGLVTESFSAETCNWPIRDKQPLLRNVTIFFLVLITLFFAARTAARLPAFGGQLGHDDYMISIAYFLAVGSSAIILISCSTGLGKDIWTVPFSDSDDQVTNTFKLITALELAYIVAVWSTKISILLLYLRIFPGSRFRTNVKFCIAFCAATAFCLFFACLFSCWPVSYGWTYWDGEHHGVCTNASAQVWANAGLNIFGDLVVLMIPLPTIWKMPLSKGKRLRMMFMFGVGILITIVSLVRLYAIKIFNASINPTWDFVDLALWSVLEIYTGVICACLPGARVFYTRVICGKILGIGQFAPGNSSGGSRSDLHSHMSIKKSHQQLGGSISTASNKTHSGADIPREFVLVLNNVDEKRLNSSEAQRYYEREIVVEEWPVPKNQLPHSQWNTV